MSHFYPQVLLEASRRLERAPRPADFSESMWPSIRQQVVQCLARVDIQLIVVIELNRRTILSHASVMAYLTLIEDLQDHYEDFSVAMGEPTELKVL